jgi:hypothetical protein
MTLRVCLLLVLGLIGTTGIAGAATDVPLPVGQSAMFGSPLNLSCTARSAKVLNGWFKGDGVFRKPAVVCGLIDGVRIAFWSSGARLYWREGTWKALSWPPNTRGNSTVKPPLKLTGRLVLSPSQNRRTFAVDESAVFSAAGVSCSLSMAQTEIGPGDLVPTLLCGEVSAYGCEWSFQLQRQARGLWVETHRRGGIRPPGVGAGYGVTGFLDGSYSGWGC